MKKTFFALACVIGLMFFASCTQEQINEIMEQKPTVAFIAEAGFISSNTSAYVGDSLNFKFKVAPNSGSESELVSLTFVVVGNGTELVNENIEIAEPTGENIYVRTVVPTVANTYAVTVTVKDAAGKMNAAAVSVDYVEPTVAELGVYSGDLTLTGHVVTDQLILGQQLDQDIDTVTLPTVITMGSVGEDNRIRATFEIDGSPVSLYCTKDGNNLTFDPFQLNHTITVFTDINLALTVNATAVLNEEEGTLDVTADATGTGTLTIPLMNPLIDFNGNIQGILNVVAE